MIYKDIIFGGSFDPVHVAHITIAQKARSHTGARYVYFLPTKQNPLKESIATSAEARLAMIYLATRHLPWVKILEDEIKIPNNEPVYTFQTVERLYARDLFSEPPYLLIGDDLLPQLTKWYRIDDLLQLVQLLVISRNGNSLNSPYSFEHITIPSLDVSSTAIRTNLDESYKNHLLHPDVWRYIREHKLYS